MRLHVVTTALAVFTAVAGCTSTPNLARPASGPQSSATARVTSNGATVSDTFGSVVVTAHAPADVAETGTEFRIAAGAAGPNLEAQVAAAPAVQITLGNGAQPKKPIELTFDLSNAPDLAAKFTDSTRPLISVNGGTDDADFLAARWDPASKTVTASTPHLSTFDMLISDPLAALKSGFEQAWKAANDASSSDCANGDDATVNGTKVTIRPSKVGIVAACLNASNDAVTVKFDSASRQYYTVKSTPPGAFVNELPLHAADSIAVELNEPLNRATLTPDGKGSLTLPAGTTSAAINLDIDAVALQMETVLTGLEMFGLDADLVQKVFSANNTIQDCVATAWESATQPDKPSTTESIKSLGDIAKCEAGAGELAATGSLREALHKISVVISLFTTLPSQLLANLTAIADQFNGEKHLVFTLEKDPTAPTSSVPSTPQPKVIDRIEITTWAYDRAQGDTYVADNTNGKNVEIFWKSFAGQDEIRSGCTSTVTLEGPGATQTKYESNCDSYDPGTFFTVKAPGTYVATVTVHQEGQADVMAQHNLTILPFRS